MFLLLCFQCEVESEGFRLSSPKEMHPILNGNVELHLWCLYLHFIVHLLMLCSGTGRTAHVWRHILQAINYPSYLCNCIVLLVVIELHIFGTRLLYIPFTPTGELCNKLVQLIWKAGKEMCMANGFHDVWAALAGLPYWVSWLHRAPDKWAAWPRMRADRRC